MSPDEYVQELCDLSSFPREQLIAIGYLRHAASLFEAGIHPEEAAMYLEGAEGLLEMVAEDVGIELLDHGFVLRVDHEQPDITVSRTATVANTSGVRRYFPEVELHDDDVVEITFEGDVNLYFITVNDRHYLESQATHEESGCECLRHVLGVK